MSRKCFNVSHIEIITNINYSNSTIINDQPHKHHIKITQPLKHQVRAYETKRIAAMKLNHANRMQMNGKGFSEERLVRKLARDYNEDVREEDRIPSGHFKSMKEFHNFLKGWLILGWMFGFDLLCSWFKQINF